MMFLPVRPPALLSFFLYYGPHGTGIRDGRSARSCSCTSERASVTLAVRQCRFGRAAVGRGDFCQSRLLSPLRLLSSSVAAGGVLLPPSGEVYLFTAAAAAAANSVAEGHRQIQQNQESEIPW